MSFKRIAVVFILLLILGLVVWKNPNPNSLAIQSLRKPLQSLTSNQSKIEPTANFKANSGFKETLQKEVQKISQVQDDPKLVEDNLKEFSKKLKEDEIKLLQETSLDLQKPQDERFLAVMLLAWTEKPEVASLLEKIAVAEIDPYLSTGRKFDFEEILRMKAVEGLSDLKLTPDIHQQHLQSIIYKTSNSQVADRAHRALWASQGQAPSPEAQDEEALKKLLQKTSQ